MYANLEHEKICKAEFPKQKKRYIHCFIKKVFESSFHLKYSLVTTFLTEVVFISLFSKSVNLSLKHPLHVFKKKSAENKVSFWPLWDPLKKSLELNTFCVFEVNTTYLLRTRLVLLAHNRWQNYRMQNHGSFLIGTFDIVSLVTLGRVLAIALLYKILIRYR